MTRNDVIRLERPIRPLITARVDYRFEPARGWDMPLLGQRVVTDVEAIWGWRGTWASPRIQVVSSKPLADGSPSARFATHVLNRRELEAFLAEFPEVAEPPAATIHLTIEGAPQP